MRIKASAGRDRKKDLREHCYKLELTAQTEEEERQLARLYLALRQQLEDHQGEVTEWPLASL